MTGTYAFFLTRALINQLYIWIRRHRDVERAYNVRRLVGLLEEATRILSHALYSTYLIYPASIQPS